MIYKYNEKTLEFVKIKTRILLLKVISIFSLLIIGLMLLVDFNDNHLDNGKPPYVVEDNIILIHPNITFSEEKLIKMISELNFKFPHIVLAQSKQETGHFKSPIFKENNNLFGMKEAKVRINIARGTDKGHAYYHNWAESVMDYALYSATYLSKLKTESQYYQYIQQYYAEDTTYVSRIKQIVEKEKLFELFEDE